MAEAKAKKGGGGKWVAIGGLALAAVVAVEAGWAGWGFAQVRSSVFPRDEALLSWLPGDTSAVVIIDPHQVKLESLGTEAGAPRAALERTRADVKKATGIDLAFDVDKLVLSPSLAVGRGRFDEKRLAERLADHRYQRAEHAGAAYLVRRGEDAIAVVDGSILLYGDESAVQAGLTAHKNGASLEKSEAMTTRLREVGWDHAVVATVRITDDKPSVREILVGSTGPRSVSVALSTPIGLDVDGYVESSAPGSAEELAKLLEEKRKAGAALAQGVGPEAGKILLAVAEKATVNAAPGASTVRIHAHVEPGQLDALVREAKAGLPLGEMYKGLRLYQLLVPNL